MLTAATDLTTEGGPDQHALPGLSTITGPSPGRAALPRQMIIVTGSTVSTPLLRQHINTVLRQFPEAVARYGVQGMAEAVLQALRRLRASALEDAQMLTKTCAALDLDAVMAHARFHIAAGAEATELPCDFGLVCIAGLKARQGEVREEVLFGYVVAADLPWVIAQPPIPMQRPLVPLQLPRRLPLYTFAETRELQRAIGDGPSLTHWSHVEGEDAMRHVIPNETLETKFTPSRRLLEYHQWIARQAEEKTSDLLSGELKQLEFDANLLFSVCLALIIERGTFSASLDDLGHAIGWKPKTAGARNQDRLRLWRWLLLFDSLRVVGLRKGSYPDPDNKKKRRDLNSDDDLLHISGTLDDVQQRLDGVPFEVSLTSGPWIERVRGDKSVLSYLGNVRTLAAKPRRRPTTLFAVQVGYALLQKWRERATHSETQFKTIGEHNVLSVHFAPFTRHELLTTFGQHGAREMEKILASHDPGHAVDYWNQAMDELKRWKFIDPGSCKPDIQPGSGYGWQDTWYRKSLLVIRPTTAITEELYEVRMASRQADKASARSRGQGTAPKS